MHTAPVSLALFIGAWHILAAVNDVWRSRYHTDPPLGMPVCEAWTDPVWYPVQRLMDDVYRTGEPGCMEIATGTVTVAPYRKDGVIVGVVTAHRQTRPMPAWQRDRLDSGWTVPAMDQERTR